MTAAEFNILLRALALQAAQMIDTLQQVVDAVDERSAVWSSADLETQLVELARWHQEIDR